jgi:hypothetical protein
MESWCFIDESWQESGPEHIGVLAAVVCSWSTHEKLAHEMFRLRRKYYGDAHARDHTRELKGRELLSNASFKHAAAHNFSKNLTIAREILEFARGENIRLSAGAFYGDKPPPLLSSNPKMLAPPFRELCLRMWAHLPAPGHAHIVFDQRLGAQEGISIAMHNYLAGMATPHRIRPLPLVAVSNICAGLQLSDIVAFIVGRYSSGDERFLSWYKLVSRLQIEGRDHRGRPVFGLFRLQWVGDENYLPRRSRTKKVEPGASGKEAC